MNSSSYKEREKLNHLKLKSIIENVKNQYILRKIFNNLSKKRSLYLIKYNNNIKNRININNNDYKEYSEIYSPIELEIIPIKNQDEYFIKVKEKEQKYFHIFFNDDKEEIKRSNLDKSDKVSKIKIIIDYQVKSFEYLFLYCKCIQSMHFKKFNRNNITNMSYMFYGCRSLKKLNLSNFNTSKVTDMSYMFESCSSLKELNLSNFNTSKVTDMSYMFSECSSLKELNLNNFDTSNVKSMYSMFSRCSSLIKLEINNFHTDNVINMGFMFSKCSSLIELNIDNFNTSKVTNMSSMFYECSSLKDLNLSNFNTDKKPEMGSMISGCSDELTDKIETLYKDKLNYTFHY